MLNLRNLQFLLIGSLAVLTLLLLFLVRKPLCIDSRVVERIDRITPSSTERIWACRFDQTVPYSPWLRERLPQLQAEISEIEQSLQRLEKFRHPVRIVILSHRPWVYRLHGGTLFVGEEILRSEGHLARGLVKAWIREKDASFGEGDLREEVYADLLQAILVGQFVLEDRQSAMQARLGARWPQVLKESPAYCRSPWKLSEHYEFCESNPDLFEEQSFLWSLRPLFSGALISALEPFTVLERYRLLRDAKAFLKPRLTDDFAAETGGFEATLATFQSLQQDISHRSKLAGPIWNQFESQMLSELARRGSPSGGLFRVDLLVQTDQEIKGNETWFQELKQMAREQGQSKFAVRSKDRLWLLPATAPIHAPVETEIFAHRRVLLQCGVMDLAQLLKLEGVSEKILLIETCDQMHLKLASWVRGDVKTFARQEKKTKFMQIHLPSLARVKDQLNPELPVLDLRMKEQLARVLEWQEVKWFEEIQSSQPKAALDAVEWFRVESL